MAEDPKTIPTIASAQYRDGVVVAEPGNSSSPSVPVTLSYTYSEPRLGKVLIIATN